jgi:hypothetical protein
MGAERDERREGKERKSYVLKMRADRSENCVICGI